MAEFEYPYEASDEASENELLDKSLSVWNFWSSFEPKEDFEPVPLDLHTACSIGQFDSVRHFIERETVDLNKKNKGGWTPLMYACYIGHDTVVNLLLDASVSVNVKNNKGQTPLMLAASCGNESVGYFLLQAGAELEARDKKGWTALFHATYAGHQDMVKFLLSSGANTEAIEPSRGVTPFIEAASEGHEIIVQYFLQSGVNVSMKTSTGDTARSLALIRGHMKIVSLIDNHCHPQIALRSDAGLGLGLDLSSSDEAFQRPRHPRPNKTKSKGPSIRDGPEAFDKLMCRKSPGHTDVPKGYVTFTETQPGVDDMTYREMTSPINMEDHRLDSSRESTGSQDDVFSKTGSLTIKSSSSSSSGLVGSLGRDSSFDSGEEVDPQLGKRPEGHKLTKAQPGSPHRHSSPRGQKHQGRAITKASLRDPSEQPNGGQINRCNPNLHGPKETTSGHKSPSRQISPSSSQNIPYQHPNQRLQFFQQVPVNQLPVHIPQEHLHMLHQNQLVQGQQMAILQGQGQLLPQGHILGQGQILNQGQGAVLNPAPLLNHGQGQSHLINQNQGQVMSPAQSDMELLHLRLQQEQARQQQGQPGDLATLLDQIGLGKYFSEFEKEDVDLQVFLSLTDNDLKEIGIKLFGPRRKMTNAIARWHSKAPTAANNMEQSYADRLEAEMQEMAIQLHKTTNDLDHLKAQVLQERELRSVTERCLMDDRVDWQHVLQLGTDVKQQWSSVNEGLQKLRLCHQELEKRLQQVSGEPISNTDFATALLQGLSFDENVRALAGDIVKLPNADLIKIVEQCVLEMQQSVTAGKMKINQLFGKQKPVDVNLEQH